MTMIEVRTQTHNTFTIGWSLTGLAYYQIQYSAHSVIIYLIADKINVKMCYYGTDAACYLQNNQ